LTSFPFVCDASHTNMHTTCLLSDKNIYTTSLCVAFSLVGGGVSPTSAFRATSRSISIARRAPALCDTTVLLCHRACPETNLQKELLHTVFSAILSIVLFGMMPCLAGWLESAGSFYLKPPTGNLGTRTAGPYLYSYNCTDEDRPQLAHGRDSQ
jgi:hypothetical protein